MEIRQLDRVEEIGAISGLFAEYLEFVCGDLRRHFGIEIDAAGEYASTMDHLHDLVPPRGCCLVAQDESGAAFGMVLLRPCGEGAVEIKRLFVRPGHRGSGAGRKLILRALDAARGMGAKRVYLDSTRNLAPALAVYEAMGFRYIDAFPHSDHAAPDDILAPHMVFMVRDMD